jgi:hypothetical protein
LLGSLTEICAATGANVTPSSLSVPIRSESSTESTGGTCPLAVIVNVCWADIGGLPSSVTTTVGWYDLPAIVPWPGAGVQLKRASLPPTCVSVAPAGGFTRLNVRLLGGLSCESSASNIKSVSTPTVAVASGMKVSTGA